MCFGAGESLYLLEVPLPFGAGLSLKTSNVNVRLEKRPGINAQLKNHQA